MISARAAANLCATAAAAVGTLLFRFSPQDYSFYPLCPFYALTNHLCPGCGATRAVAELLHGHVVEALQFNAVVTLLLPALLCCFARVYWTAVRENRVAWPRIPAWSWTATLAGVLLFGVLRDLTHAIF
jgi:hypothetical protein